MFVAGFVDDGELSLVKKTKAFNAEFTRVSQRLGRLAFSLVLAVQSLVFVAGVLTVSSCVLRCVLLLLSGVDPAFSRHLADVVRSERCDAAAVDRRRAPGTQLSPSDDRLHEYLSTSDILSLSALRLFSETKV